MSGFHDNVLLGASGSQGYQISRSVRLRSSASAYFNRTPGSAGDRQKFTISFWMKRGTIGTLDLFTGNNANGFLGGFRSDNTLYLYDAGAASGGMQIWSARVFRDPSAWYHIVIAVDTTQATDSNRFKVYINGIQETISTWNVGAGASRYPSLNGNFDWNNTNSHEIGYALNYGYFDGYLTEFNNVSGQQLDASSFGETNPITGVWQPKKYAGAYGTNGFYLNFSDNSAATAATIGKDYSGNGNNWTPNNISVTAGVTYDSMLDVPTQWADGGNGRGNYSTMNPLDYIAAAFSGTASNGNLTISIPAPTNSNGLASTIRVVSAAQSKFYIETTVTSLNTVCSLGMISGTNANYRLRHTADITLAVNDVVMTAFDPATGNVWYGRNGSWLSSGNPAAGTNPFYTIPAAEIVGSAYCILATNGSTGTFTTSTTFGQQPFAYTPPTGFKALNTLNLPTPTILKGNQYFDAKTYTGTGATQTITVDFAPNFAWLKRRDGAGENVLMDTLRLTGSLPNRLFSNSTAAESTAADGQNSFSSTGIVLDGTGGGGEVNTSGRTYVGWQWKEGATQGFDIVTYTGNGTNPGRTVAHNLGVAPAMIITKSRSGTGEWPSYHKSLPISNTLYLNATYASSTYLNRFSAVSSTDFTTGSNGIELNTNGVTYVAYLFAEVAGFSKFGTWQNNNLTDGAFIYLGFRPRFILLKNYDNVEGWFIWDSARQTYNMTPPSNNWLNPNLSNAEGANNASTAEIDGLSNGFKIRTTNPATGEVSFGTRNYIYAAFAESPFKNSLAR